MTKMLQRFGLNTAGTEALRRSFESIISAPPFEHMCNRHSDQSAWPGQYKRYETQLAWEMCQAGHTAGADLSAGLLDLIYRIRVAAGDPTGKLMQDELVEHIADMRRLLREALAALDTWADVAPAVSLRQDIRDAVSAGDAKEVKGEHNT